MLVALGLMQTISCSRLYVPLWKAKPKTLSLVHDLHLGEILVMPHMNNRCRKFDYKMELLARMSPGAICGYGRYGWRNRLYPMMEKKI